MIRNIFGEQRLCPSSRHLPSLFQKSAKAKFRPFFVLVLFFIFHEKSVIHKARGVKSAGEPLSI